MQIKQVEFVKSSPDVGSCPPPAFPEYAFVGRSNVGKSTLINFLTDRKNLAKTSTQPGKTRLINHFLVDDSWYLTDLPGYGYARLAKSERNKFIPLIHSYLLRRKSLSSLFVLIDSRHPPLTADLDFIRWLGQNAIPFALCFTKTDKISSNKQKHIYALYEQKLQEEWEYLPPVFFTSSANQTGRKEILEYIDSINRTLHKA